jgi:pimeloyl-ACP methyl ester carboxylesterase
MPLESFRGDTWILLRGLTRSSPHWGDFPVKIATQFPGAAVHCLDLPGNGRYHQVKTPTSIPEITEFVKRDFEALMRHKLAETGEPGRCFLVSLSLGSMVAVDWITRYPGDFSGVVLMNTSLSGVSPVYHRMRLKILPLVMRIFAEKRVEARERLILKLTSRHPDRHESVIPGWVSTARAFPITYANVMRQLTAAMRFRVPGRPPVAPLLILSSKGDELVDSVCSEALRDRWVSTFRQHPTAGHDLPLDEPEWVLDNLRQWRLSLG